MKIKSILILVLIISPLYSIAQSSFAIYLKGNYNYFTLTKLKDFQNDLVEQYKSQFKIPLKTTSAYPGYYGIQIGFLTPISKNDNRIISVGGFLDYMSTGGRIHYSDYSGELKIDQILSSYSLGTIFNINKAYSTFFSNDYWISFRGIYSLFNNSFSLTIYDQKDVSSYDFHSYSLCVESGITPSIKLNNISLGISLSYMLTILPGTLYYNQNSDAYLMDKNGMPISTDFGGIKTGIRIMYTF